MVKREAILDREVYMASLIEQWLMTGIKPEYIEPDYLEDEEQESQTVTTAGMESILAIYRGSYGKKENRTEHRTTEMSIVQ